MWQGVVGWNDRTAPPQLDWHMDPEQGGQSLEDHGGCTYRALLFCELMEWCWAWWPVPAWQGAALVAQSLLWLRKESQTCHSASELCVTWETATTCREQCLARVMVLVIPGGLRPLFVLLKSQRRVKNAHSKVLSKISRGIQNAVLCLAEWSSGLRWGCRHKATLSNNSLGYEFIGVCELVLNRDAFTFPLTCLLPQGWEDSKGSSQ